MSIFATQLPVLCMGLKWRSHKLFFFILREMPATDHIRLDLMNSLLILYQIFWQIN